MKKKTRNFIFNAVMIISILAFLISGVFIVRNIKSPDQSSVLAVENIRGMCETERGGVAYFIKSGSSLRNGDRLTTSPSSEMTLSFGEDSTIVVDENTSLEVISLDEKIILSVSSGKVFIVKSDKDMPLGIVSSGYECSLEDAVFSQSVNYGTVSCMVYSGKAVLDGNIIPAGTKTDLITTEDGNISESGSLTADSLEKFFIENAIRSSEEDLCFTQDELASVLRKRAEEKLASSGNVNTLSGADDGREKKYCTVTITCESILGNMDKLSPAKTGYVPEDGMILENTEVYFFEGETAFDVLKRVCETMDIQLEYSFTPIYNSHYVEGINHLYEFDCGAESGWMYKTEGWFPNYGASNYKLSGGENIVWAYTCRLGEDIGGNVN